MMTPLELAAQLYDPETRQPFVLLPAERRFLEHAFLRTPDGRLRYPEQVYACPKKSGKTTFAALHTLITTLLFGGSYPEATVLANDLEQARGRVFEMCRRIVECSPLLKRDARLSADKITFPGLNATISAVASDYAGAAGGNQCISTFDELWAYTSERSHRLWDEMIPPPTRQTACRLTVTYAGFEGESTLLEGLYRRGLALPLVPDCPDLHAGDGLLMFWSHLPIAPWQSEAWLADMRRSLRPAQYLRMIENRFVTTESSFIDLDWWDACVDAAAAPLVVQRTLPVTVGIDASVKHDSTAIVADPLGQAAPEGGAGLASHLSTHARRPARFRGRGRGQRARAAVALSGPAGVVRSVPDGGGVATPAACRRQDGRISAVVAQSHRVVAKPVRIDQGPQPRRLSRCRAAAGNLPRGSDRECARLAHRQGQAGSSHRRRHCAGDGGARRDPTAVQIRQFAGLGVRRDAGSNCWCRC